MCVDSPGECIVMFYLVDCPYTKPLPLLTMYIAYMYMYVCCIKYVFHVHVHIHHIHLSQLLLALIVRNLSAIVRELASGLSETVIAW